MIEAIMGKYRDVFRSIYLVLSFCYRIPQIFIVIHYTIFDW